MARAFRNGIRIRTLRENLLLTASSFAFMALNLQRDPGKIIAFPVALIVIALFYAWMPGLGPKSRKAPAGVRAYAALAAGGICLYAARSFIERTRQALGPGQKTLVLTILAVAAAALSLIAVYTLSTLLLDRVYGTLRPLFRGLGGGEAAVFALIAAALAAYSCYAFLRSSAFRDSGMSYEVIYTSDSPSMIEPNVFLWLYHPENDLRQPLFAVFAAPLTAPAYLLGLPFSGLGPAVVPMLMNLVQVLLLAVTYLMLAGMLRLKGSRRICFLLIAAVTYPALLFSVMTEQYIIAVFWLVFAAYSYTENRKASVLAVSAAGGTLLTSLACLPMAWDPETDGKGPKAFLTAMGKAAAGFLALFLAFGRLDTLTGLGKTAGILSSFAGGGSLTSRVNQYLSFISSCFAAPDAAADTAARGYASWQLTGRNIVNTDWAGAVILGLCLVSLILNRKDRAVRIAGAWAGFSALLLLAVGWGAPENGMILYTLYFSWAFLILLFRLIERIGAKLNAGWLTPAATCTIVAVLGWLNARGIGELLAFAFTNYPG